MSMNSFNSEIDNYRLIFKDANGERLNINHLFSTGLLLFKDQKETQTIRYECVASDINPDKKEIAVYLKNYVPKYLSMSELAAKYHTDYKKGV